MSFPFIRPYQKPSAEKTGLNRVNCLSAKIKRVANSVCAMAQKIFEGIKSCFCSISFFPRRQQLSSKQSSYEILEKLAPVNCKVKKAMTAQLRSPLSNQKSLMPHVNIDINSIICLQMLRSQGYRIWEFRNDGNSCFRAFLMGAFAAEIKGKRPAHDWPSLRQTFIARAQELICFLGQTRHIDHLYDEAFVGAAFKNCEKHLKLFETTETNSYSLNELRDWIDDGFHDNNLIYNFRRLSIVCGLYLLEKEEKKFNRALKSGTYGPRANSQLEYLYLMEKKEEEQLIYGGGALELRGLSYLLGQTAEIIDSASFCKNDKFSDGTTPKGVIFAYDTLPNSDKPLAKSSGYIHLLKQKSNYMFLNPPYERLS